MTEDRESSRFSLAPKGPFVARPPGEAPPPPGFFDWGGVWRIEPPSGFLRRSFEAPIIPREESEAEILESRLRWELGVFLLENRARFAPDPLFAPPASLKGLARGVAFPPGVGTGPGLRRFIEAHGRAGALAARAEAGPEALAWAPELFSVLPLPGLTEVEVARLEGGGLRIRLFEHADLARLWAMPSLTRAESETEDEGRWSFILIPAAALDADHMAAALALARAVQIARLFEDRWIEPPRLDLEVGHLGLRAARLRLLIERGDWGAPLERLAQALAATMRRPSGAPPLRVFAERGPHVSLLQPGSETETPPLWSPPAAAPAVAWRAEAAPGLEKWTYGGSGGPLSETPFAMSPTMGVAACRETGPAFRDLDEEARSAYRAWLAGPRRELGFRPIFGALYLQGLEYRLLRDSGPQKERQALAEEIRALAALFEDGSDLQAAALRLWDWLGVFGLRRPTDPEAEGPYALLAQAGRATMESGALEAAHFRILSKVWFSEAVAEDAGGVSPFAAPRVGLRLSYRSLSGFCCESRRLVLHGESPVPDLRRSAHLARLAAQR